MPMVYLVRKRERELGGRETDSVVRSVEASTRGRGGRGAPGVGRAEGENRFDRFDSHLPDHVAPAYVRTLCIMQPGCMCNA